MNYRIVARAGGKTADLFIYGAIGHPNMFEDAIDDKRVVADLKALGQVDTLNVRINSPGGNVFAGQSIFNAIDRYPGRVVVHIDGVAASIASVIAMAGAEIRIAANALVMIHNASGIGMGTAEDMRHTAEILDTVTGSLRDVYARRTKNAVAQIADWMDAETWFTAREAVANGFADSITEPLQIAACGDFSHFKNAPASIKAKQPAAPLLQMREARLSEMLRRQQETA